MFKHFLWGEVRGINRIDHGSPPGQVRPLHHPTIISQAYLQLPPSSWLRRQRLAHDPKKNNNHQEKKLTKTPRNKDKRHTACLVLKTKTKREKRNEDKKRDKKRKVRNKQDLAVRYWSCQGSNHVILETNITFFGGGCILGLYFWRELGCQWGRG